MSVVSLVADEAISAGNAVYVTPAGKVANAIATSRDTASVAGLALNDASTGALVRVDVDGVFSSFSGLTPGQYLYVSLLTPGALVTFAQLAADLAASTIDAFLTNVGEAVSTTSFSISVEPPQLLANPNSYLLLESSTVSQVDALLLENGSFIDLETASA